MDFEVEKIYHVYNRGNNKQRIFFNEENYLFFLRKIRKIILPNCELLAYCLMPNHFHLLIYATEKTVEYNQRNMNVFSEAIRQLLSQYTKAINKEQNRTSSLFQQNTKAKEVQATSSCHDYRGTMMSPYSTTQSDSRLNCFIYIHKNPFELTNGKLIKWKYSSYLDYAGMRNGTLCNRKLTYVLLGFKEDEFLNLFD